MELKVIKSFANPSPGCSPSSISVSKNVEAIVEGVTQAGSYRSNRHVEDGLLEIYDLRKDKTDDLTKQPAVRVAMNNFSPRIRFDVWPVFGSSKDARAAGFDGV